jgi:hypothetical protein
MATYTELDASKKWCPFTRLERLSGSNRDVKNQLAEGSQCVGSKCMGWEWDYKEKGDVGFCGYVGTRTVKSGPKAD